MLLTYSLGIRDFRIFVIFKLTNILDFIELLDLDHHSFCLPRTISHGCQLVIHNPIFLILFSSKMMLKI